MRIDQIRNGTKQSEDKQECSWTESSRINPQPSSKRRVRCDNSCHLETYAVEPDYQYARVDIVLYKLSSGNRIIEAGPNASALRMLLKTSYLMRDRPFLDGFKTHRAARSIIESIRRPGRQKGHVGMLPRSLKCRSSQLCTDLACYPNQLVAEDIDTRCCGQGAREWLQVG